ncbi:sodium:solute symporter family transporter [Gimibacter soli]|uniref:Sodium/proline symporter n=1 Tax=Gimibacter soli TaxID=3024400 RepID=A0AAE9XPW1_9PROT|nr:hypothetical protein [Gimibacter soli]WCL54067.1 hypothetical protein PH603_16130 [Gimibacter soli]
MDAYAHEIILGFVALYMVFCIGVGLWAMKRTHTAGDFFVAGRGLGPWVVSLAVFSSTLSGFGFVGGPGLVYATGLSSMWMATVSALGFGIGYYLIAKRIRMIAELRDTVSLPDLVMARYESNWARGLSALTILLGVIGYLATQILAMAMVLQSLLADTAMFAGISLAACAAISSAVLIFYCVTGGIIASVYTDLIQGFVMMVAGVLVVVAAIGVFDGGLGEASQMLMDTDPESALPFGTMGPMAALSWFFLFGFGLSGQPHVTTKMMMNRRLSDNRIVVPITVIGYVLAALLWVSIGMVMRALVIGDMHAPLGAPDEAAPVFLREFANPILAGIVFAGLFAAIMSTADSFLNIGAAAIIHDIPKAIRGRSLGAELFWARVATIGLSIFATLFALYSFYENGALIGFLGVFGWGTFASALLPVVMFGLNWKRASARAAVAAIVAALAINIGFYLAGVRPPHGMDPGFVALLVSLTLFIIVSLLDKPKSLPKDIDRVLDL